MSSDLTTLVLVRHGHHDPDGRFQQHQCSGLTDDGRRQADRLAHRLRATDLGIDTILTSRAARTIETGAAVADALGLVRGATTCALCEMHPGEAEGLTVAEMNERFGPNYSCVPGAEYFPDWLPAATGRLRQLADEHEGRTLLAVTHMGVVRASFVAFGGVPVEMAKAMSVDNTSLTIWTRPTRQARQARQTRQTWQAAPHDQVWTLERHNDTAHLESAVPAGTSPIDWSLGEPPAPAAPPSH